MTEGLAYSARSNLAKRTQILWSMGANGGSGDDAESNKRPSSIWSAAVMVVVWQFLQAAKARKPPSVLWLTTV
jgi:hypothetical protein